MRETWVQSLVGKIPWRRERVPTPVFWPGELHAAHGVTWRSPWGSQRVRHYWAIFTFTFIDVFGVTEGGLSWTDDWEFFVKLNFPADFGGKSRNVDNRVQFKPFSETKWCLWLYIIHAFPPLNDGRNVFFTDIYVKHICENWKNIKWQYF